MHEISGPDFICIGMPKAGTGWLFDQLEYHPDFWMPPVKEIDYLIRDTPQLKNVRRRYEAAQNWSDSSRDFSSRRRRGAHRRAPDERDLEFLEEANSFRGKPRDMGRYASLFRFKGGLKSGDISPTYIGLTGNVIAEIEARLPQTKILLLVRDPIARAASQISMAHRRGKLNGSILESPGELSRYLKTSVSTRADVFPTVIAARWRRHAPRVEFCPFLFDRIETDPRGAIKDILIFLGADPNKKGAAPAPDHNRKASARKLVLNEDARKILRDHFAEEILACAREFGDQARDWVKRHGLLMCRKQDRLSSLTCCRNSVKRRKSTSKIMPELKNAIQMENCISFR